MIATVEQSAALARDCAAIIGPQRQFYATRDHADDIDAVRTALGVPKIGLIGVSYGTKLALAYALAHPGNVERIDPRLRGSAAVAGSVRPQRV